MPHCPQSVCGQDRMLGHLVGEVEGEVELTEAHGDAQEGGGGMGGTMKTKIARVTR
jgi:hypothetical protein